MENTNLKRLAAMCAAAASLSAWWALGVLARLAERYGGRPPET